MTLLSTPLTPTSKKENHIGLIFSGSLFGLHNESWSGKKKQGDVIAFSLLGDYEDSDPDVPIEIKKVILNDEVMCP